MRLKVLCAAAALCASFGIASFQAAAQVAPAASVGGLPIGVGVGFSRYLLDYGPGRYMEGPVARASVGLFHGLGVDVSARSLFMDTPSALTRMEQSTFLLGGYYEASPILHIQPFARFAGGIGVIEFPSRNPAYTRDSYTVYAPSGGVEVPVTRKLSIRAEYEYQFWKQFHGPNDLTPRGATLGVTYYLRGRHLRQRF
jgi:opacity protein-like surface antigen